MLEAELLDIVQRAGFAASVVSALLLGGGLLLGLSLAVLQAATQVQEQSLGFAAKLIVIALLLYCFGGEISEYLLQLTHDAFRLAS